jgi:hypothetical protein
MTPALPVPYPALANAGLRLRRGQVSLTVAAPGVGKSQFWLNVCSRTQVNSMFWSADTDAFDVVTRATALWSGVPAGEVEEKRNDPAWAAHFDEQLARGRHVDWVFDSSITARSLADRLNAHAEIRGTYPELTVIDNLSNVVQNPGDELAEQKGFMKDALDLAQETKAHIAILAHAEGQYDNGNKPIPLSGVLNKLSKIPSVVLTLHREDESGRSLGVVVAKNRGGLADPAAHRPIHLDIDFAKATVLGFERVAA